MKASWKTNLLLKGVIVIGTLAGWLLAYFGGAAMFFLGANGVYADGREQVLKAQFARVAETYSIMAVADEKTKQQLEGTNFRYGIIEGKTLEEAEDSLDDPEAYAFWGFDDGVPEDPYIHSYSIGKGTELHIAESFLDASYVNNTMNYMEHGIIGYASDEDEAFYVKFADGSYAALPGVTLGERYSEAELERMIRNGSADAYIEVVINQNGDIADPYEHMETADDKADYYLIPAYSGDDFSVAAIHAEVIKPIPEESIKKSATVNFYSLPSGNAQLYSISDEDYMNYVVVSAAMEPLANNGDLFWQTYRFWNTAYDARGLFPVAAAAGIFIALLCTVLFCRMAGHRRESGDVIIRTGLSQLPFEVRFLALLILIYMVLGVASTLYSYGSFFYQICLGAAAGAAAWLLFLVFLWTVAINIKAGNAWKRTLLGRLFGALKPAMRHLWEDYRAASSVKSMKRRAGFWFAGITLVEFLGVLMVTEGISGTGAWGGVFFLAWLVEKVFFAIFLIKYLGQFGRIRTAGIEIAEGNLKYEMDTGRMYTDLAQHGEDLNRISKGMDAAVLKRIQSERFQAELITNVSHDIKTPLTSIISYIDLLKKEEPQGEKVREYIEVLSRQSERLKKLTGDIVEASKASSGSVELKMEPVDLGVLLLQMTGEYEEKLKEREIELIETNQGGDAVVMADSRSLSRVLDNLLGNMVKYAMPRTRAYLDVEQSEEEIRIILKNISNTQLNISGDELMQRFVRGDRSRSSEGSGLGLSIAKSLMQLMQGDLVLTIDGDLFKVEMTLSPAT